MFYGKGKDRPLYNLKDYTVWCVRIPGGRTKWDEDVPNLESAPCKVCLNRLRKLGFGRVAFTREDGSVRIENLNKYETEHLSFAQRKMISLGVVSY